MRTSAAWEKMYTDVKGLADSLWSYHRYLLKQLEKSEHNRNLDHPARPLAENCSVFTILKTGSEVKPKYKPLDKAVSLADYNEPVFFDESLHTDVPFDENIQRLRYFEGLQLSVDVDVIKYCPGGAILTTWCFFKAHENRNDIQKQTDAATNILKITPKLPEYHTRMMKQNFKRGIKNIANIQPSVLDMIYKDLTLDATAASHPDTQLRLQMIVMGETGLLTDLRKLNPGRPTGTFDEFFSKLGEIIHENTAADDRRHSQAHMSQYMSVKDLISQAKERCPAGTDIPSSSLVRLQFMPRNPYAKTALSFTSKLPIQYKIQRRQLRVSYPDDHYTSALFKYLRSFAVRLGNDCALFFCDDKAKVPFGEPDMVLSTGVRGKKTLTPSTSTLVAADHDMHHKGSLTPSVYMKCDVPDSVEKSFYRGKVTTVINDSIFQSSNPMRHAATLVRLVKKEDSKPKVLLKFTDGGTDHRNTLEHVKCASICMFKELDLDMFVACRCAPGQSYTNPAERIMSILNIGLQNCALSRQKSTDEVENCIRKCNSMDSIRKVAVDKPEIKEQWEVAIEPLREVIENRFKRLSLKDEPIEAMYPTSEEEMDILKQHLHYLFPQMNTDRLVKAETNKVEKYAEWLDLHCKQSQYCFQIRKCDNPECCGPSSLDLEWIPDPMLDDSKNHYRPFDELYGSETSECDRPTFQKPTERKKATKVKSSIAINPLTKLIQEDETLLGDASVYTAQNARTSIECVECNKPRLVYSKSRLNERTKLQLALALSEGDYTCGSPLTTPEHPLHGKMFVRMNIDCSSPMETSYFSCIHYSSDIAQTDRCYYCGVTGADTDETLKLQFKTVYPICVLCKNKNFETVCMRPFGKKK
ncbi:uncharacterized protein LOC128217930 [Mya arenaria]|uniref:uncharacterized protein LOC128217930 n=1 Tax=Mya arenaria TaxID=6604 RepID=UPI0022E98D86|nr:uncharacterized protein LOC128217930 [Mya arenaria]XP_052781351.1 uncharacterized protein LOC128217930 [Mya arenaria]